MCTYATVHVQYNNYKKNFISLQIFSNTFTSKFQANALEINLHACGHNFTNFKAYCNFFFLNMDKVSAFIVSRIYYSPTQVFLFSLQYCIIMENCSALSVPHGRIISGTVLVKVMLQYNIMVYFMLIMVVALYVAIGRFKMS